MLSAGFAVGPSGLGWLQADPVLAADIPVKTPEDRDALGVVRPATAAPA